MPLGQWKTLISVAALLLAAAAVGIIHMSAPDHWLTLVLLGRTAGWSRSRLIGVGVFTAIGHVAASVVLGFLIVLVGLAFSRAVSNYITYAIGLAMVVGGLAYGLRELAAAGKEDPEMKAIASLQEQGRAGGAKRFGYFAVLGTALSPDLAILPIFLLALPVGLDFLLAAAVVFAVASIGALLLFLLLGVAGLSRAFARVDPKYNDALVGFIVAGVGVYVLLVG